MSTSTRVTMLSKLHPRIIPLTQSSSHYTHHTRHTNYTLYTPTFSIATRCSIPNLLISRTISSATRNVVNCVTAQYFHTTTSDMTKTRTEELLSQDPKGTLFAKFANGTLSPDAVFNDDRCIAFKDINPAAPTHILIISKKVAIGQLQDAKDSDDTELGYLLVVAGKIAKQFNLQDGYRLVINQGPDALQTINYLHIHLLAGKSNMSWPPC